MLKTKLQKSYVKPTGIIDPEVGRRAGEAMAKREMALLWQYAERVGLSIEMIDTEKERINGLRKRSGQVLVTDKEVLRDLILENVSKEEIQKDSFLWYIKHSKDVEDEILGGRIPMELPKSSERKGRTGKTEMDLSDLICYMGKNRTKK